MMDLEQMKSGWNTLSAQLEQQNTITSRLVCEMISSRNRTNYEQIARAHQISLAVIVLMATLVLPYFARTELIRMSSFALIEVVSFAGIAMAGSMLNTLARLGQSDRTVSQLTQDVLTYKRLYGLNQRFGTPVALATIGVVYAIEQAFTANALIPLALALGMAIVIGVIQTRRQNRLLREIEQGIAELREFANK
ncbi:MAG: hypothetical protein IKB14_00235 [Rikenellaceae bacterium]|nr:hypothetical protein [Rikenellaceae bacterium]MBR2419120.1 hypothetical protein [Rikenellaceae bacterium]MBR3800269.1 hypothetical protein [Rikenellaceae bacterium]